MVRWMTGAVALALAISLAGPAAAVKSRRLASRPECSACKMKLSTRKTATTPVAVKVNGKTYYCCSKCNMSAKTSAKTAAAPKCSACKMTLSAKKTAALTRVVKVNGRTYYCCDGCDMGPKKL